MCVFNPALLHLTWRIRSISLPIARSYVTVALMDDRRWTNETCNRVTLRHLPSMRWRHTKGSLVGFPPLSLSLCIHSPSFMKERGWIKSEKECKKRLARPPENEAQLIKLFLTLPCPWDVTEEKKSALFFPSFDASHCGFSRRKVVWKWENSLSAFS